jgi:Ca2+-binding RTX toxin-like protein
MTLDAGTGTDLLAGGAGDDFLTAQDGTADYRDSLLGDDGNDTAVADAEDILTSIEQ